MDRHTMKTFLKNHRLELLQLGILAGGIFWGDTCFANDVNNTKVTISALDTPMNVMKETFTGPIPTIFTVISAAVGGTSWAMGLEQQITKYAIRATGGGAVAMGAGSFISDVTGCLF